MNLSTNLLSDVTVFTKYAKYIPELNRRETFEEVVNRYLDMMIKRYPEQENKIRKYAQYIYNKDILMSMRAAQFAGIAAEKNNARIYNCAFLPIDDYRAFREIFFLLLGGTGVGFSVQYDHIKKLPSIKPLENAPEIKFLVGDSIEGWSDALDALMKYYFGFLSYKPRFDYSDIRQKGERLVTSGGKAPGPGPLKDCLNKIDQLLAQAANRGHNTRLKSIEAFDIICHIADAVLAGGIRRAALIALFNFNDEDMRYAKFGEWWKDNLQRARANISAVVDRTKIDKKEFDKAWNIVTEAQTGEFGFYFTNDKHWGTNPCVEVALRAHQFCNLTEINGSQTKDEEHFYEQCRAAAYFGTLQAGITDFHYLRPIWKEVTEQDRLIGVGITGICSGSFLNHINDEQLQTGAEVVRLENFDTATEIGINPAARTTVVKPSGTTSCVLGTSSGIHAWHDKYYVRNIQCKVGDDLYNHFTTNYPEMIKVMDQDPSSAVIGFPIKASSGILREKETAIDMLERVKTFNHNWIRPGHNRGSNYNNVSSTVNVREEEWQEVGEWMWENRDSYNGLAIMPYWGGNHADLPFSSCTKEEYDRRMDYISKHQFNISDIIEIEDNTDLTGEVACAGGACEITF